MMSHKSGHDLRRQEETQETPVAVVGLSCRFADVDNPDQFWGLLSDGEQRIRDLPSERNFVDPPSAYWELPAGMRRAGFLSQVDSFDARFFGIAPREAAAMDPQQRLMLELGWEAFEDAGIVPDRKTDNSTGVFVGAINDDYALLAHRGGADAITPHTLAGLSRGIIANRISYALGMSGPSLTIDAGQASALTAVNLARGSVVRGESDLALAGGVNLILSPLSTLAAARFGALSPDGHCYTFDARANGYVRGEGGGFVLLKRLDDALADGDRVYCVLHGGGVNNDGYTPALTIPSVAAQEAVFTAACAQSGIDPADVDYVELHGTGTPTGDPIEACSVGAVFGQHRLTPVRVGSVKTNVGHLEGAAGIAGLIKAALSIHHREFFPSLNFAQPNPAILFPESGIQVQTKNEPWYDPAGRYLAGVSSFGMGGANCHLILGAPSESEQRRRDTADRSPERAFPLVISGRSPSALRGQAAALTTHLDSTDASLVDVAYSLATTRTAFEHRAAVTTDTPAAAAAAFRALAEGQQTTPSRVGTTSTGGTAFLFSGQGAQRVGMGSQLMQGCPEFRRSLEETCSILEQMGATSLRAALSATAGTADAALLDQTGTTQPALFAFEVALFRQLQAWGVRPDFVAGHSVGEVAAAHVAGVLSLDDACALISTRGALMQDLPDGGGMLSIRLPEKEIISTIADYADRVAIAAVNSPTSTVVSGDEECLATLAEEFARQGVRSTQLRVSHAFHSMRMDPMLDRFRDALRRLDFRTPRIPLVSNVTGDLASEEVRDPDYWVRHARSAVRFADSVACLSAAGVTTFVEVGPGRALSAMAEQCLDQAEGAEVVPLLPDSADEERKLFDALAALHVRGVEVNWEAVFRPERPARVRLPTYAFQRSRAWLDEPGAAERSDDSEVVPLDGTEPGVETLDGEDVADTPHLVAALVARGPAEQRELVTTVVCRAVATALGFDAADAVDARQSFHDLGCDSVMSVELRDRLTAESGVSLPATLVFDHPTPMAVAEFLLGELDPRPVSDGLTTTVEHRSTAIDAMSADDLVRLALDTPPAPTDLGGRDDH